MSSNRLDIAGMAQELAAKLTPSIERHLRTATKCCPNCENFSPEPIVQCKLNNMRPPSTVIAFGCEMFEDNNIPF